MRRWVFSLTHTHTQIRTWVLTHSHIEIGRWVLIHTHTKMRRWILTHSRTQMRRWFLTHSLRWEGEFTVTHSPTFIYMCKWVYLLVLYIKANMMSVCVDKNWAVPGRILQSLPVPWWCLSVVTNRARRPGQPLQGGWARCHFY